MIREGKLKEFISSVKADFIRFKGYVNIVPDKKNMVQGTYDDYTFKEVKYYAGITELIGIGRFSDNINYTSKFENHCIL